VKSKSPKAKQWKTIAFSRIFLAFRLESYLRSEK